MDFTTESIPRDLSKSVALSLYRIIPEGFTNITKYASARHATVSLQGNSQGLFLSVRDDGIGFDMAEVRKKVGLGLSSIRERVSVIHGTLHIHSEPGMGTTIEVKVPLEKKVTEQVGSLNGEGDPVYVEAAGGKGGQ